MQPMTTASDSSASGAPMSAAADALAGLQDFTLEEASSSDTQEVAEAGCAACS